MTDVSNNKDEILISVTQEQMEELQLANLAMVGIPNDKFSFLPIDREAKIPLNVFVPCPKGGVMNKRQVHRQAALCCPDCHRYAHLARTIYADTEEEEEEIQRKIQNYELLWSDVYQIRCATIYEIPCVTVDTRKR